MTIRAGIVGFGTAGRYFHAPLLRAAGFAIPAVVTSKADRAREYLGEVDVLGTAEELIARSDIDLVVIASPSTLHASQAADALNAGKHVVVDKPIAATAAEVSDLDRLAERRKLKLAVFHNRRWDSDFLTLRKLIEQDRLGTIGSYFARWDRFRPNVTRSWRDRDAPGHGILYDLGTHLIDQTLVLFGMPEWLFANVYTQREGGATVDGFEILMGQGKLRISLGVNYLTADGGYRYRVNGSRASFLKPGLDPQEAQLKAGMEPTEQFFGIEPPEGAHWCKETPVSARSLRPKPVAGSASTKSCVAQSRRMTRSPCQRRRPMTQSASSRQRSPAAPWVAGSTCNPPPPGASLKSCHAVVRHRFRTQRP